MKSHILHTVSYYISGEAAGGIWNGSLLGVKGLTKEEQFAPVWGCASRRRGAACTAAWCSASRAQSPSRAPRPAGSAPGPGRGTGRRDSACWSRLSPAGTATWLHNKTHRKAWVTRQGSANKRGTCATRFTRSPQARAPNRRGGWGRVEVGVRLRRAGLDTSTSNLDELLTVSANFFRHFLFSIIGCGLPVLD